MADDRDIVGLVAEELGSAFAPLTEALSSEEALRAFLLELGWDLTSTPPPLQALDGPARGLGDALGDGEAPPPDTTGLIRAIGGVVTSVNAIGQGTGELAAELPRQLIDHLVAEYLLGSLPVVGQALRTVGIIRLEPREATATRPAYLHRSVAWEDLLRVTEDPGAIFRNAYGWGGPDLDHAELLEAVRDLLVAVGLPARLQPLPAAERDAMAGGAPTAPQPIHDWALRAPLMGGEDDSLPGFETGLALAPIPATGAALPGFAAMPYASETIDVAFEITETLTLVLEAAFDVAGGIAVVVRPDTEPELRVDLLGTPGSVGAASARLAVGLDAHGAEGGRLLIVGAPTASRFDAANASVTGGARMDAAGKLDAFVEVVLNDGRIVVAPGPGEGDGFLAKVLPPEGLTFGVALSVGLSSAQGLYFGGSGALEVSLPVHVQLGPLEIQSATIAVRPADEELRLDAAATFKAELGPLKAVVEGIGLRTTFTTPPGRDGALGPIDLALGLKPPTGVGLSISAGPVKGGGFLLIDPDRGEYGGALELTVSGMFSLKAIGLITTRMPDGSQGFSLIVIITAEFGTGLQLGYGFMLKGVGGLLGLHRTMLLQPLMEGVKTGAINGIMFPTDVVANAPRILNDLRTIFPPQEGTFLVGPMAKLSWATVVTLSLGVIIEIPGAKIAILGVLRLALPTDDDDAVVVLQVSFAGALELDRKRAYFFASLFESRILFMTIEGEMGVLVAWGEEPNVLVSVGGFHPRFDPPPLPFPSPRRIALSILDEDQAKVRVEGYMAVTTNTAQFGARAELFFGFDEVAVKGDFAFDALFVFRPFSFEIDLSASMEAKVFGIGLFSVRVRGRLTGPTPWRIRGTGSISLFLFEVSIDIDRTFGDVRDVLLGPVEVLARLLTELAKSEAWQALPPAGTDLLVSLRKLPEGDDTTLLHPVGVLRVSQRSLPLELTLDKVGAQLPSDVNRLSIAAAGGGLAKRGDATELFAPAQFQDMPDADKLSRPAFGRQASGIELRAETDLDTGRMVRRVVRYEEIVLDVDFGRRGRPITPPTRTLFGHFLKGSSVARSPRSRATRDELRPRGKAVEVGDEGWTVAFQADNAAMEGASFASEAAAREHLRDAVAADPALAGRLHVVPDFEVAPA
jgi:hypothetical protein